VLLVELATGRELGQRERGLIERVVAPALVLGGQAPELALEARQAVGRAVLEPLPELGLGRSPVLEARVDLELVEEPRGRLGRLDVDLELVALGRRGDDVGLARALDVDAGPELLAELELLGTV
jgi:hypothetical protein